ALHQLLLAMTVYEKDVDYVVTEANPQLKSDPCVIIIDQTTGRLRESSRWEHGLHTAIEVKEGVKTQKDFDGLGVISLKNYLRLYSKVAGMSGTILAAADELKELYGLNSASLPTHKTNIRIDLQIRVFKTGKDKDAAILETVKNIQQSGRPILIGCLTIKRAEYLTNLLRKNGVTCNLLDARNEKEESLLVAKAGLGNTVTVATSIAGRGTDIKPDLDALANGGLMIVGADLFGSVRIDQQLKGRTGRQGNPGSSVFFASLEDPVLRYLSESDKKRLDILAKEISDQGIVSSDMSYYFKLAQDNRENSFREKRRETARKDDIIAPRRKTFYENRNAVLHNPKLADKIIDSIIDSEGLSRNDIYRKLQDIYDSLSIILKRSQFINPDIKRLPVPFSCQGQPFALTFYIKDPIFDFESLINDYKRQLILTTYDKYWKKFVLYILDDLDQKEIEGLDQKFTDMLDEVDHSLAKLISDTRIIFNPRQFEDRKDITKIHKPGLKTKVEVPPYNPCPCGSGKKYCECHGGNTRNKVIRRR
ncbi:MAG: SEC-C domain-containing protein, partial [Muribaculaceae bacterium]|nr:SEC-C domain-containing protein [Muribaculaceae bacterium]